MPNFSIAGFLDQDATIPNRAVACAASIRVATPSLAKMAVRWWLTVFAAS
jgi:hypothetical protein